MNLSFVLTSSSFSNPEIEAYVLDRVKKKQYKTVAMVTSAHPKKEYAPWIEPTKHTYNAMGLEVRYVDFEKGEKIEEEDIVYVCGGNTPKLLYEAQKQDMKTQLHALAQREGLYIGSSAGSILLSPSICAALEISPADKNEVGLKDFTGLCVVPFHMIVHYDDSNKNEYSTFKKKHKEEVFTLRNGEAIVGTPLQYCKIGKGDTP